MERKLASIQRILSLFPIEGANKIEAAQVLGWKVVVQKGLYKVGDFVVYCEVDSIIPFAPWSDSLRDKNKPDKLIRLRTVKLRGQLSQGICFPTTILSSILCIEGEDVTSQLGIIKYVPPLPACLAGKVKGYFPSFLRKTDETRIQSVPNVLKRHVNKTFYVSEKVDGSNANFFIKDGQFGVCSRNLELLETEENSFWQVARRDNWENKLRMLQHINLSQNFCCQLELIGPGIQGNKYKLSQLEVYLFNIFDIDNNRFLNYIEFIRMANYIGAKTVPILYDDFILTPNVDMDALIGFSMDNSKLANVPREGIVIRPLIEERDEELGRLSFKVINPNFLLKHNE